MPSTSCSSPSVQNLTTSVRNLQLSDDKLQDSLLEDEEKLLWQAVAPFSKKDFREDYYPMYTVPRALLPSPAVKVSDIHTKLFYGLMAPPDVFISYVVKHQILYETTSHLASEFGWPMAMREATRNLGRKYNRLLTTCVPMTAETCLAGFIGVFTNITAPWFFYTWEDDEELLYQLKQELGICDAAHGVWYHAMADFDTQETVKNKLDLHKVAARRAKRVRQLEREERRARNLKRKGSSDTIRAS